MTARWKTISQIFDAALDMDQAERAEFIRQACGGDLAMESEVVRLLAADEKAGSFLERPVLSALPVSGTLNSEHPLLAVDSVLARRFQIVRFIGRGGMGQVYEAIDLELNTPVAVKIIRPEIAADPRMLSRFRREAQLTRKITHPNVCRTFDIERDVSASSDPTSQRRDLTFLTMELLEGETLSARLRHDGRICPADALPLVRQMIGALAAAHAVDVIHRDLKPSNVLLVPGSGKSSGSPALLTLGSSSSSRSSACTLRVVVTDFGLARAMATPTSNDFRESGSIPSSLTGDQAFMGTLVYMAPEQFERGETSVATDIYSLGLVLFEMITGRRPFADEVPFAEATKRLKQPAPSAATFVPDLSPGWDAGIARCLALDSKDRFENVLELAEALTSPGHGLQAVIPAAESMAAEDFGAVPTDAKPLRRRKYLTATVLSLALVSLSTFVLRHYWMKAEEATLAEGSTVLLTNIQNSTEDKRFDGTTDLVRHQVLQSPYFSIIDSDQIHKTLAEMLKPTDTALDPQTAREVAMRNGVRRVVFGAISRVGDRYVLDLDIEQPDNNPLRFRHHWENHWTWNAPSSGPSKDMPAGFLDTVRDSSDWIRHEIGESAKDIAQLSAPPEDVTTANWEALSDLTQAEVFRSTGQSESAVKALQNAVTADPNFALAYARLGDILVSLSRFSEGYAAYEKSLALGRQRLSLRERDRIEGIYANDTWNYVGAEAAFNDYVSNYRNDYLGWFYRATPLMMMGRVEEAIESLKKATQIDPGKMFAPAHIARFDLILGDYEDSAKWIQHLRDRGYPDDADLVEGESDFLQGRLQQSQDCFTRMTQSKNPLYRSYGYSLLTRLFAEQGMYAEAMEAVEKGLKKDIESGDSAHRAEKLLDRGYLECRAKQYDACLQDTKLALGLDRSLQRSLSAATVLGHAAYYANEDMRERLAAELRSIEAELPKEDLKPLSAVVRMSIHREVLLAESQWQEVLEELKTLRGVNRSQEELRRTRRDDAFYLTEELLGRALSIAAERAPDKPSAKMMREEALTAFETVAEKPGLVWQAAMGFVPGAVNGSQKELEAISYAVHRTN